MSKERNISIDVIKAVSILLVILGHSVQYGCGIEYLKSEAFFLNPLFEYIYSFHMPLFAIISGYLFYNTVNKRNFKEVLINRVQRIFIPIISWQAVFCLWGVLKNVVKPIGGGDIICASQL